MNALLELLASGDDLTSESVRAATRSALRQFQHDRRLSAVTDFDEVSWRCEQFYPEQDQRLLGLYTGPMSEHIIERERRLANEFAVPRFVFDIVDGRNLDDEHVRVAQSIERSNGAEVRTAGLPFRAHIVARERALLAFDFDENLAGAYYVEVPELVSSLVALHARLWTSAPRADLARTDVGRGIDIAVTDILRELVSGRADEAAARHLAVSLRTYRRRVADVMAGLGVTSRFAAGAEAQRRGLLDLAA